MTDRLLICTDLDRTLIPNGAQPESPSARRYFAELVAKPDVTLVYVSGRHRALVEEAIKVHSLPCPDFVIGDVGTTIYEVGAERSWQLLSDWEEEIALDWAGKTSAEILELLKGISGLRPQEPSKQNDYKLSYYLPLDSDVESLHKLIRQRLESSGVRTRLIWSIDEAEEIGLLDILPARASKYHAIEMLMKLQGFDYSNSVFCGDSGNDIEVLASPVPAVLVANCMPEVREQACRKAEEIGCSNRLYVAKGDFMGMNGNYSAGMLEGIAHYYPHILESVSFEASGDKL